MIILQQQNAVLVLVHTRKGAPLLFSVSLPRKQPFFTFQLEPSKIFTPFFD